MRDADLPRAAELADAGARLLEDARPEGRFEALDRCARDRRWLGDLTTPSAGAARRSKSRARPGARTRRRAPPTARERPHRAAGPERGRAAGRRALELAEESGSIAARAGARLAGRGIDSLRGRLDEAAAGLDAGARSSSPRRARRGRSPGRATTSARSRGTRAISAQPRSCFRESIRLLTPLADRGTLCESQRGLAQLLVSRRKIDEAESFALEARETVGPEDTISRATTRDGARAGSRGSGPRRGGRSALQRGARDRRAATEHCRDPARRRCRPTRTSCASASATTRRSELEARLAELRCRARAA